MKLALVGVGDAGSRIVDRLIRAEVETDRWFTDGNVLAFNTAATVFDQTESLPDERQILIGDTHPAATQRAASGETVPDSESESTDRCGVGGNPDAGAAVAEAELPEIRRALDLIDETEVAATMLVTGLGGGTGSGVGSVLLEELKSIYESPVYVLGVLPAATEPDHRALNAARGIRTVVPLADAVFPVDNETLRRGVEPVSDRYGAINDVIASRVVSLFGTGERDPTSVSEMRIDPADVRRTVEVGGVASIGYETVDISPESPSWLGRLWRFLSLADDAPVTMTDAATVKQLIRRTLESELTLPCDISSADRVLLILSGPPSEISRKGFETGRYLLEQETRTVEVLAGDEPLPGATTITATVLFANVTDVSRIDAIQRRAIAAQESEMDATGSPADFEFEFADERARQPNVESGSGG